MDPPATSSSRNKVDYASVPIGEDDDGDAPPPMAFEIGGDDDDDLNPDQNHDEEAFHDETTPNPVKISPQATARTTRRRAPPVDESTQVCCCCCCRTTRRRRRRCIALSICSFLAYIAMLWLYIYILSGSTPRGYDVHDQHLGPFSLLLLPLTPWVRTESRQELPELNHAPKIIDVLSNNNTEVQVLAMPRLQMNPPKQINDSALQVHLGSELSGCDPKFILQDSNGNKKYLFKPNKDPHKVWNELLAYWINDIGGFRRVPTVWPFELDPILQKEALNSNEGGFATQKLPFVKCNFDLDEMDQWINHDQWLVGTLQLMVHGVSKRSKAVNRLRSVIGKWSDRRPKLTAFQQREINTRSFFDFIIGNYDRYNNDFIQTEEHSSGDKVLVYIDQGSFVTSAEVGRTIFPLNEYCRFYWRPVRKIRELPSLKDAVLERVENNNKTQKWAAKHYIGVLDHPTVQYMDERVVRALQVVDDCVTEYGHEYVFLEL
mmetsp:Transcript_19514/g.45612  ORF Transcript_19514/g.45612 Transcript_19514/m.45612 type:complete len:489 (-) Transcript_19514:1119-2585(-)